MPDFLYSRLISRILVLLGLTVLASLSPLLTLSRLWQLKEWRWDRLLEQLRAEGWISGLFGTIRPVFLAAWLLLPGASSLQFLQLILLAFAGLSAAQISVGRQPFPVWTKKAALMVVTALSLTGFATVAVLFLAPRALWPIIGVFPILQSLFLLIAWLLLLPLDQFLKKGILDRARLLRSQHPDLTVIGITGSVGKTTTKELLAHLLKEKGAIATPAYVNTEMGVSAWLTKQLETRNRVKAARGRHAAFTGQKLETLVVEMGAYRKGEIALLCKIAQPTIGVVTYVGSQHLALFGSQENIAEAKGELIRSLPANGHAFLNGDNEWTRNMKETAPCPATLASASDNADVVATEIEETPDGLRFSVHNQTYEAPLHGRQNVTNILLAIAVAEHLGMTPSDIAERLRSFSAPAQTFAVRTEKGITILDDTHNSSEASVEAAIEWARARPETEKVLLMSGLIELGPQEKEAHREAGRKAKDVFDRVVFTHERGRGEFEEGFGGSVELLTKTTQKTGKGGLVVCVGRMPTSLIDRVLPTAR